MEKGIKIYFDRKAEILEIVFATILGFFPPTCGKR